MTTLRLEIPIEAPTANWWLGHDPKNRIKYAHKLKKDQIKFMVDTIYHSECRKKGIDPGTFKKQKPTITYVFYRKRLFKDPGNIGSAEKPFTDALVKAGVLKDDTFKDYVRGEPKQFVDGKYQRTVIFLEIKQQKGGDSL